MNPNEINDFLEDVDCSDDVGKFLQNNQPTNMEVYLCEFRFIWSHLGHGLY